MTTLWFGADVPCSAYNCAICCCVCPLACTRGCLVCLAGGVPCCGSCCGACAACIPEPTKIYTTETDALKKKVKGLEAAPTSATMERQWFVL
jgi:hypothetical protein